MISTHIRTEGLYVKTTIIYQLKRLCVPDCAYTENMFINSIHISLYGGSLTQNILYQIKRDVVKWKRLGCPQCNQRTWWQIVATPYTIYGVSVIVFAPSIEVENDVVGAAPTGDDPTTSERSTILLHTKVCLILEDSRCSKYNLKMQNEYARIEMSLYVSSRKWFMMWIGTKHLLIDPMMF